MKEGEKTFEAVKEVATLMPHRAVVAMVDYYLARVKAADGEEETRAMETLRIACTIAAIHNFDSDDSEVEDAVWKKKAHDVFERLTEMQRPETSYDVHSRDKKDGWRQSGKEMKVDMSGPMIIETKCPYCLAVFKIPKGVEAKALPSVGDGSLCTTCGMPALFDSFDGRMILRKPINDDENKGLADMDDHFAEARAKIKALEKEIEKEGKFEPELQHIIFRMKRNGTF